MKRIFPLIAALLLALVPFLGLSSYLMHILILVIMWVMIIRPQRQRHRLQHCYHSRCC